MRFSSVPVLVFGILASRALAGPMVQQRQQAIDGAPCNNGQGRCAGGGSCISFDQSGEAFPGRFGECFGEDPNEAPPQQPSVNVGASCANGRGSCASSGACISFDQSGEAFPGRFGECFA